MLIYFITNVISPNRSELYIDSPNWMKNKATINPINKNDNKCLRYAATLALN